MSKRILVILLSFAMMLSLASCGVKQSLDDKIAEKVTEGVLEKATGDKADIDVEKGQLTVTGKDGEKFTVGDSKWPEGGAARHIPEFKKGKIISAVNSDKAAVIMMEQVEEKDFKQYVEELKAEGFTHEVQEYTSASSQSYVGQLNENTRIAVAYELQNKALTLTLEIIE